jgi:riboflavin synthase
VLVSVIPFTVDHTTLKDRRVGDPVNVEFDLIGKHVARLLGR